MKLEDQVKDIQMAQADIDDQHDPTWDELPDEIRMGAPKHLLMYTMRKKNEAAGKAVS